ncbi:cupin [Luteitalea sp. TBR-22]|uniref:cupin domain-containing protein n=1 Tax=Luteitalea sp. TBR-22 TaxID=2802971 RepID=UPI001AFB2348|nr:cupin domain-containing protein [Luteitalea sp. TBR-22]BCS31192.1 cupin [Luteitalea sp. TBR-22]
MTVLELIQLLRLSPLPGEGGYFRQTWQAPERVAGGTLGARYPGEKALGTAIYYLVTDDPDGFSAMHRLPTDEVYHFYLGDPVEQLLLHPDGGSEVVVLGQDLRAGQRVQHVAPRDSWQGTRLVPGGPSATSLRAGRWALLGTTMAPGFDVSDYQAGERAALIAAWPTQAERILALTRQPQ